ncbi:MAG TPA: DUF1553 domain-containing protein, partial [Gemmatales bacterium]|nr:DUF1553 domain-containing protein [Gemmatales bacterium]
GRDATTRTTDYPLGTKAMQLPDTRIVSQFLTAFGRPEREQVCACERESDATVAQALHVYNGSTLNEKLQAKHSRLDDWQKLSDEAILNDLFLRSLSRTPTAEEKRKYLAELKPGVDRRLVHEDWCWAVLTSKEFLFNH